MMSTKSFLLHNLKTLPLVLIVFTIFTIALTENLQIADGFSVSGERLTFETDVGETQMQEWMIKNRYNYTITIEVYATNPGSELLEFEKYHTLEPGDRFTPEIFVIVPKDHPDNVEYHVDLFGLLRGELEEGQTGIIVNNQARVFLDILIGDDPVYTAPPPDPTPGANNPALQPAQPRPISPEPVVEEVIEETMEEKLKRIQEANTAVMGETPAEATGQFEVKDPVPDFEPGPQADPEALFEINPVGTFIEEPVAQEEKVECGFIDWLLSLFGMAKC